MTPRRPAVTPPWASALLWPAALLVAVALATPAAARQPNVILFLMDDMGWRDVGFMGNEFVETPAIDRLARGGMVFTRAYASAPNCAPTRACLMSGQVPPRHGIYTVVDPRHAPGSPWQKVLAAESATDLATEVVTLPEVFGSAGYASARDDRRDDAAYAATILASDRNVARVVERLERLGLRDDTILVFTSDN
ncbi:MAG: sulfatase-like hydrolase/transferase, partial [Planctomycetaceae bacterium]